MTSFFNQTQVLLICILDHAYYSPGLFFPECVHLNLELFLALMADDEVVDPKNYLEESCKPKCVRPLRSYQACVERVKADESGHKHCTGQYFDYWSCVDSCVATKLFEKLK
ncbi:hypothetical protein KSP39_PZI020619 [Platanthera zijinensis]|uniref:Complex III subunit VI n=1 Tax=Platanthera zijinensis TaxID=2320716 RepID=A0AAP0AZ27_9ASPA